MKLLNATEVLDRMRGGDFPTMVRPGGRANFSDGRQASYGTMIGLMQRKLVEAPADLRVSNNWMPSICHDCGHSKINHKPGDGCRRMQ